MALTKQKCCQFVSTQYVSLVSTNSLPRPFQQSREPVDKTIHVCIVVDIIHVLLLMWYVPLLVLNLNLVLFSFFAIRSLLTIKWLMV